MCTCTCIICTCITAYIQYVLKGGFQGNVEPPCLYTRLLWSNHWPHWAHTGHAAPERVSYVCLADYICWQCGKHKSCHDQNIVTGYTKLCGRHRKDLQRDAITMCQCPLLCMYECCTCSYQSWPVLILHTFHPLEPGIFLHLLRQQDYTCLDYTYTCICICICICIVQIHFDAVESCTSTS